RRQRGGLGLEEAKRRFGAALARAWKRGWELIARCAKPRAKTAQIALDRLAVLADRRFERFDRNRELPAARDRAEHDRIDDRAGLLGGGLHVEQQMRCGILLHRLEQALGIVAPVAHLHLLDREIDATDRRDQQSA